MADMPSIEKLLKILEGAEEWPLASDRAYLRDLYTWQAFREVDHDRLKLAAEWPEEKFYVCDPLAERIAEAFGDLLFGEEPDFTAASDGDQANLEQIVEDNMLPSELQSAAEITVSEGETYWRVYVDKDLSEVPIIEYHSRTTAYPLFRGRRLVAIAFISVIEEGDDAWRYVEAHAQGVVVNRLYQVPMSGTNTARTTGSIIPQSTQPGKAFGSPVDLNSRPETEGLPKEWNHELPVMLAGRVVNKRVKNPRRSRSQYAGVKDLLFELNEAATIGKSNMKLTARKRAIVDQSALTPAVVNREDGNTQTVQPPVFDSHEDIFIAQTLDESLDSSAAPTFKVMEYTFDATSMVTWDDHLVDKILTRTRTAPQLVGRHTEQAQSAPALRARLLDSILAATGKGRYWDDQVPQALRAAVLVDQLSSAKGGFGRSYSDADTAPAMKRKEAIPEDIGDKIVRHAQARGSELESLETALQDLHPEWDTDRINEERDKILSESGIAPAPPPEGGVQ